ncbi:MAG: 7-cyano-7-deazaguanine synthase QueC [Thermodesulfobacteriota bacterium]|nr:MAG: 7-cyano-7-deazaguanine synthase QueC [Thermodesulfobacteriota bacterium]
MIRSVVLLSGGLDSTVTAAIAVKKGECAFLHVNYGQRTEAGELKAFNGISDFYNIKKRLVSDITHLREIGGSALTDKSMEVPEGDLTRGGVPSTYVPFRNAHLLAIAVSWAEVLGAEEVYMGAVEEDSSGYPDCREEFFHAFEKAANSGTRPETVIRIITPLIHMRRAEIVKKGAALGAPYHLTWSCYSDDTLACGRCDSCLLRIKGFNGAGIKDPVPYRKVEPA